MTTTTSLRPCLWFDEQAEDAANFYVCVFPNSRVTAVGVSWQVVPRILLEWMTSPDAAGARRVTQALRTMGKLDLAALRRAYEHRGQTPEEVPVLTGERR